MDNQRILGRPLRDFSEVFEVVRIPMGIEDFETVFISQGEVFPFDFNHLKQLIQVVSEELKIGVIASVKSVQQALLPFGEQAWSLGIGDVVLPNRIHMDPTDHAGPRKVTGGVKGAV